MCLWQMQRLPVPFRRCFNQRLLNSEGLERDTSVCAVHQLNGQQQGLSWACSQTRSSPLSGVLQAPQFPRLPQRTASSQLNYLQNAHSGAGLQLRGRILWKKQAVQDKNILHHSALWLFLTHFCLEMKEDLFKPVFLPACHLLLSLPDHALLATAGSLEGSFARWATARSLRWLPSFPAALLALQPCILVNCLHRLAIILSLAAFKGTTGPRASKFQHRNPRAPWLLRSSSWLSVLKQWSSLLHIHFNIFAKTFF